MLEYDLDHVFLVTHPLAGPARYSMNAPGSIDVSLYTRFYLSPMYGNVDPAAVTMRPSRNQPAGTVTIVDPADSAVIPQPSPGHTLRFQVSGTASLSLGMIGCPHRGVHVCGAGSSCWRWGFPSEAISFH